MSSRHVIRKKNLQVSKRLAFRNYIFREFEYLDASMALFSLFDF